MSKTKQPKLSNLITFFSLPLLLLSSCKKVEDFSKTASEKSFYFHEHVYSEGWACNETTHWHPDLCGHSTRIDEGKHIFGEWIVDSIQNDSNLKIKHRICSVCGYTENVLPHYYNNDNYLVNRVNAINKSCSLENVVTFSFITDLHLLHNSFSSKELMKVVLDNTPTSFIVCGGDIVSAYCGDNDMAEQCCNNQLESWNDWLDYWSPIRVFPVRGNHDFIVNNKLEGTYYKKTEEETILYSILRNKDVISYDDDSGLGLCYSYDYSYKNLRLVFIDDYTVSSKQQNLLLKSFNSNRIEWLINTLEHSDGYHLIVVSHEPFDDSMSEYSPNMEVVHNILSAFKNRQLFEGDFNGRSWRHDFSKAKGELICALNGHSHKDESHVKDNVLSISTTCDVPYNDDKEARIRGSISESAFDVFNIDLSNNTIRTIRIGAGKDRYWEY